MIKAGLHRRYLAFAVRGRESIRRDEITDRFRDWVENVGVGGTAIQVPAQRVVSDRIINKGKRARATQREQERKNAVAEIQVGVNLPHFDAKENAELMDILRAPHRIEP